MSKATRNLQRKRAQQKVKLLRKLLNRTDRVAVLAPWGKPCPAEPNDIEALLEAHVGGEEVAPADVTLLVKDDRRTETGHFRVGTYSPAPDGTTRFAVLDFDTGPGKSTPLDNASTEVRKSVALAKKLKIPVYIEQSGGGHGFHLWVVFEAPVSAKVARAVALRLAPADAKLVGGAQADPKKNLGIEVFPKQETLAEDGVGHAVWLPHWNRATFPANEFVQLKGDDLVAYQPRDFKTLGVELATELSAAPAEPGEVATKVATPAVAPARKEPPRLEHLVAEAIGAVDLADDRILGKWLTGKTQGKGWLECRDPESPTGDRTPSAGVADGAEGFERGTFHSFRTGEKLSLVEALIRFEQAEDELDAFRILAEAAGVKIPEKLLRPQIIVNAQYHEVFENVHKALMRANNPPTVYNRNGHLARLVSRGAHVQVEPLERHGLYHRAGQVADYFTVTSTGTRSARPPADIVSAMLVHPGSGWPKLKQVIATPVYGEDAKLIVEAGYNADYATYYAPPPGFTMKALAERPTVGQVKAAVNLLRGLFSDFPIEGEADWATLLSALVLPFVRRLIVGPTPLHLFEAPAPGTGKSLICQLIAQITTGQPAQSTTAGNHDEEVRKKLTAELSRGSSIILLDNLDYDDRKGRFDSPSLASVLTATVWTDRRLGHTMMLSMPNLAMFLATGNNVRMSMELARRSVRCRLDAAIDQPWLRAVEDFAHPDIRRHVIDRRADYVHAILILIQNWLALGKANFRGDPLGSFEAWSRVVGGVLQAAEVGGFLENLHELYEDADAESEGWSEFVDVWWLERNTMATSVSELVDICKEHDVMLEVLGDKGDRSQQTCLGIALGRQKGRVYGDYRIALASSSGTKGKSYRLEVVPGSTAVVEGTSDGPDDGDGEGPEEGSDAEGGVDAEISVSDGNVGNLAVGSNPSAGGGHKNVPEVPQVPDGHASVDSSAAEPADPAHSQGSPEGSEQDFIENELASLGDQLDAINRNYMSHREAMSDVGAVDNSEKE